MVSVGIPGFLKHQKNLLEGHQELPGKRRITLENGQEASTKK
jgi:hypothetical protein